MNVSVTPLEGLLILEPSVFGDDRGYFMETWSAERYRDLGIPEMVQDNLSFSKRGVLRGLHFQNPGAQGKLVQVVHGEVFDVAVDVRKNSPTFGQWFGLVLSSANNLQFWVPEGFAHGFVVTSETALFSYKCSQRYRPDCERSIRWDDPTLSIAWPVHDPVLSSKDASAPLWDDVERSGWIIG